MRNILAAACLFAVLAGGALAQSRRKKDEPPPWDPLRAEKAIEVGRYYMKKKNYDAAIDRFKEAIIARPDYALPHKLAAEAYEKKRANEEAVEFYEKYLEILPQAPDADAIRGKIAELKKEIEREQARKKNPT
jgi:Tfp pilus assembly protein PilF